MFVNGGVVAMVGKVGGEVADDLDGRGGLWRMEKLGKMHTRGGR